MSKDRSEFQPSQEPETDFSDSALGDIADKLGMKPFAEDVCNELRVAVRRYALDQKIFGAFVGVANQKLERLHEFLLNPPAGREPGPWGPSPTT